MERKTLSIWDQEELHYIAEEVIVKLRFDRYLYDDEGNCLYMNLREKDIKDFCCQAFTCEYEHSSTDYLNFRKNRELHWITFYEALEMPLTTVRERYLKDVLTKARNILRKDSMHLGYAPSEEIPDSYLDDLLALRWRENLKLWAIRWDRRDKEKSEIWGSLIDLSDFIWTEGQTEKSVFLVMDSEFVEYALAEHFWIYCGDTRVEDGQCGDLRIYLALRGREGGYTLERAERFLEDRDGEEVLDLAKLPDEINEIPVHKTAEPQRAREQMRTRWGSGAFYRDPENPEVWHLEGYTPQ